MLIRHALPQRTVVAVGPADPVLSEQGVLQSAHLAEYLASEQLDALYSSPMRRAIQTAEPVAAATGLAIEIVEDVAEFDRDSSEYIPAEELKRTNDPRWQMIVAGEWDEQGDSPAMFSDRVVTALEKLVGAHRGERIAVVCHGGVIGAYVAHILGMAPRAQSFFYPNYTSIHRIAASTTGARSVVTLNETAHLRGTGLPVGMFQQ